MPSAEILRFRPLSKQSLHWAIVLLAVARRWPLPLPEWTHVDERALIMYPLGFWGGDFNPHFFHYPALTFYLYSALYYVYFLLLGTGSLEYFVAYRYFVDPSDLLIIARTANALASAATVAVCMAIGSRLYGRTGGRLAGLLLAVMPLHTRFASLAITDVCAGLCATLAILYGVRAMQTDGRGEWALAGLWAGLAAGSKYPAGLALVAVLAGCALARHWRWLWLPLTMAALAFVATSPYTLLDWAGFQEAFERMAGEHLVSMDHSTGESAWQYWLYHNLRHGLGWVGLLALPVALVWPGERRREEWVVVIGAALYVGLLFTASSVFMRYAQPLVPLLAVLLARWGAALPRRGWLALWLLLMLAEPLHATLRQRALLAGADTRIQARDWLATNAPQGQRIVQVPKGSGQVPLFTAEQVFVRMDPFIASFGVEGLKRALQVLARGPALPPLYLDWSLRSYGKVEFVPEPDLSVLVLRYEHPLTAIATADSLAFATMEPAVKWLTHLSGGRPEDAIFDEVDWHFVPIGRFAPVVRSGPTVRIGALPWYQSDPLPTGKDLFAAYGLLLAANQATSAQRWAEAVQLYQHLLDMPLLLNELFTVSYMYEMFLGMGAALDNIGAEKAASEAWLLAAETERQEAEPYFRLGKLLAERGQYEESVKYYLMAEDREPDDMVLLYNLGAGLMQLGRNSEAVARFERAAALAPSVENLLGLTLAYGRNGQRLQAQAAFARVRTMAPDHPQVAAIARMLAEPR